MNRRRSPLRHPSLQGQSTLENTSYAWDIHPLTGAVSISSTTTPSGTSHFRPRRVAALSPSPLDDGPFTVELLDGSARTASFSSVPEGILWALELLTARQSTESPGPSWWQTSARRSRAALLHGSQVLHTSWGDGLEVAWALTGRRGVVVTEIESQGHAPESVRVLAGRLEGDQSAVLARARDGELLPTVFPNEREAGAYLAGRTAYEHVRYSRAAA